MIKIQETRCGTESRKDCNHKRTCQLRHSNEEAGKDLEYYTRKFDRTTSAPGEEALLLEPKSVVFPVTDFTKVPVRGDGHCIIHSVCSLLQDKGVIVPNKSELLEKLKLAFQADLDCYAPFINGHETDPIEEMEAYVQNGKYGSSIVDLIVPLIAKVLQIGIVVVLLDSQKEIYVTSENLMYPSPELIEGEPLYLLKSGSHYDPLHGPLSKTPENNFADDGDLQVAEHNSPCAAASFDTVTSELESDPAVPEVLTTVPSKDQPSKTPASETLPSESFVANNDVSSGDKCDLDPVRILASLCANAPDYEVRDCLRKYSLEFSLKRQKSAFNAVTKPILIKTAEYLHVSTDKLNKPDIVNLLICKIQNLLPDVCQICNKSYVSDISDPPFLACCLCGQEVHKQCFLTKLGLTNVESGTIDKFINPLQLPGIHYFCAECEKDTIPIPSSVRHPNPLNTETIVTDSSHAAQDEELKVVHSKTPEVGANINVNIKRVSFDPVPTVFELATLDPVLNVVSSDLPAQLTQSKLKTKICMHYRNNNCKHGLKGKDCPYLHPERCQKLLQNGTKSPDGCSRGKKCPHFHPKMCPSSISKRICLDDKCTLTHVKGTKRKLKQAITSKSSEGPTPPATSADKNLHIPSQHRDSASVVSSIKEANPLNNSSFLDMINVLKKELCEAMDSKIAQTLMQMQPGSLQHNASLTSTHLRFTQCQITQYSCLKFHPNSHQCSTIK